MFCYFPTAYALSCAMYLGFFFFYRWIPLEGTDVYIFVYYDCIKKTPSNSMALIMIYLNLTSAWAVAVWLVKGRFAWP